MMRRVGIGLLVAVALAACGGSAPIRHQLNGAWEGVDDEGAVVTLTLDFNENTLSLAELGDAPLASEVVSDQNKTIFLRFRDGSSAVVSKPNGHIIFNSERTGAITLHRAS